MLVLFVALQFITDTASTNESLSNTYVCRDLQFCITDFYWNLQVEIYRPGDENSVLLSYSRVCSRYFSHVVRQGASTSCGTYACILSCRIFVYHVYYFFLARVASDEEAVSNTVVALHTVLDHCKGHL